MRTIKYGGQLVPGDFIAVSYSNYIDLGWYAGDGRGTLQYYSMRGPIMCYRDYESWLKYTDEEKAKNKWMTSRFDKGFTRKCIWKSYINSVHRTRVIKLTNVEEIITEQEDRIDNEKSREVMIKLNLVKQP
jgi:hypothetical protein